MPGNTSHTGQDTESHDEPSTTNDSTKTERGSPVPDLPDASDNSNESHGHNYNPDQDLIGFGSQFDTKN
ncbi:hypothetical protein M426DRAFT_15164 [Hypoxylon sp. CI-4A]|nr:hypothetical protein M426DRAFT_15164 [Hypoxylon sp. CI-4A]